MTMLGEGRDVTLDQYIQLWLGLVGGCVGLHIPIGMADNTSRVEDGDLARSGQRPGGLTA